MRRGRVYVWTPPDAAAAGGRVSRAIVSLPHLDAEGERYGRLCGRYVRVRNGGAINEVEPASGTIRAVPIGDARPNAAGDFLFEPGHGGGRIDKVAIAEPGFRTRYIQAAHFGEVNTYFHLDRIASYVDGLLAELGAGCLPVVIAVVNAHHAATERDGVRDGLKRGDGWVPFQGGHYRLPSGHYELPEYEPISPTGEIHLGPGRQLLLRYGAMVKVAGGRYRSNASHNAGILYHEYGHHVTRHTADFRANSLRRADRQSNRKVAIDEGTCDYLAAVMLETPHIWAWHMRHDEQCVHPRSLASARTMASYDPRPEADAHWNGTIWGAALWDLRTRLSTMAPDGARQADLLVLKALLLIGRAPGSGSRTGMRAIRQLRASCSTGLAALLKADELLHGGQYCGVILGVFSARGIYLAPEVKAEFGVAAQER